MITSKLLRSPPLISLYRRINPNHTFRCIQCNPLLTSVSCCGFTWHYRSSNRICHTSFLAQYRPPWNSFSCLTKQVCNEEGQVQKRRKKKWGGWETGKEITIWKLSNCKVRVRFLKCWISVAKTYYSPPGFLILKLLCISPGLQSTLYQANSSKPFLNGWDLT